MEKRLLSFLQSEDLNPTRFADRIGVQRSSISHILSGRNKPSYDFLVRIMEAFPQLNAEWLLTGKGKMYKSDISIQPTLFDQIVTDKDSPHKANLAESTNKQDVFQSFANKNKQSRILEKEIPEEIVYKSKQDKPNVEIERIVIFYTDRTFKDYKQE